MHAVDASSPKRHPNRAATVLGAQKQYSSRWSCLAYALAITWLTGILDQRLDEWVDPPKGEDSPFVVTTYPKG